MCLSRRMPADCSGRKRRIARRYRTELSPLIELRSSKRDSPSKRVTQSKATVQSGIGAQSVFCDHCNQQASFVTGTYFTANEFLTLLQKGLQPHQSVFIVTQLSGISKEALVATL